MRWSNRLSTYGLVFFGYGVLAAIVTIVAHWPAQFGGPGVPRKFPKSSSLEARRLSTLDPAPPLGGGALIARHRGRWGIAAAILLLLLGVVFVIGGFGEIFAPDPATAPRVVLVVGGLIAAIGGIALASLSVTALVERFRRDAEGKRTGFS